MVSANLPVLEVTLTPSLQFLITCTMLVKKLDDLFLGQVGCVNQRLASSFALFRLFAFLAVLA